MKFRTEVEQTYLYKKIDYNSNLLNIGSCFIEHISERLDQYKFHVVSNPFGIVYNPVSIAQQLKRIIEVVYFKEKDIFFYEGIYRTFHAHSRLADYSAEGLLNKLNSKLEDGNLFLRKATHLFITFGTAFVHHLNRDGTIVANNHKQPVNLFTKHLLQVEEIISVWQDILDLLFKASPDVQVVFTISPVRHFRDGLIENNRSKSVLFVATQQLMKKFNVQYFPAYEYVVDDLRDYRFYEADLVHPNSQAIQYVWENFKYSAIDPTCLILMDELDMIIKATKHKPFYPETEQHKLFRNKMLFKIIDIQKRNPGIDLQKEISYFS